MSAHPESRQPGFARRWATTAALTLATILLFDVTAWFLLPERFTAFSSSYKKTRMLGSTSTGQPAMTRPFPRHYFKSDGELGFDINPGARGIDQVDNVPYEVFANSLGCFDRNDVADFKTGSYYYFAGDSFTWGFADYESKFATVWERATGLKAAKCGVTHTGQAHQFEKFRRFMAKEGKPHTVFVGFYGNDPVNDAAYPHTTVVGGYLADYAFLRDGAIVHAPLEEVRTLVEQSIRKLESRRPTLGESVRTAIWVFSLSANILNHARVRLLQAGDRPIATLAPGAAPGGASRAGRFGDNMYYWYRIEDMKTGYASDPKTEANRAAILRWAAHAREYDYRLVFLLFPLKSDHSDITFFDGVRAWMDANRIEYLDLARLFAEEKLTRDQLYWAENGHWNPEGNRIVGRLLAQRYPR